MSMSKWHRPGQDTNGHHTTPHHTTSACCFQRCFRSTPPTGLMQCASQVRPHIATTLGPQVGLLCLADPRVWGLDAGELPPLGTCVRVCFRIRLPARSINVCRAGDDGCMSCAKLSSAACACVLVRVRACLRGCHQLSCLCGAHRVSGTLPEVLVSTALPIMWALESGFMGLIHNAACMCVWGEWG